MLVPEIVIEINIQDEDSPSTSPKPSRKDNLTDDGRIHLDDANNVSHNLLEAPFLTFQPFFGNVNE